ncbi:MAG: hypothetical protein FWG12_04365 [Holophagaceae bacterium]|nr:hypothetical protein [Holophagaceae bacterium]
MALFSFGKDKQKEESDPTVLAYLEDAQRTKCPAMIIGNHKNEIPCSIVSIQEGAGTLQLQLHANLIAEKGTKITFIIIIDNMRIGGASKIHEAKPSGAVIDIPASLELMERRKKQRAKINPREGTTCILLSGLFDGIGITGLVENMSENGARIKVEKALEVQTEKPIKVTSRNVQNGQIFPILKISKIPRCVATLEGAAKLVYSEVTNGTTYIGISFEEMKSEFARLISNFVTSRTTPAPNSLPPRSRRSFAEPAGLTDSGARGERESIEPKDAPEGKDTRVAPPAIPATVDSAPPSDTVGVSTSTLPSPEGEQKVDGEDEIQVDNVPEIDGDSAIIADNEEPEEIEETEETINLPTRPVPTPLQRLKRKARTIVLFGHDEEMLVKALIAEGYGRVECPESMDELIESIPPAGTGLLLLDLDMPLDECLTIASGFLSQLPTPPPVILISENNKVGVGDNLDAQRMGISLLLPRPLKINDALFNKMEELMGIGG